MTEFTVDDDGILNLPDDLLEEMRWKEGDELVFEDQGDGSFSIRKNTRKLMTHPLTDEICDQIQDSVHPCDPENMRSAADWQLEQVIDWLRNNLDEDYIWAVVDVEIVIIDLKQAMRPTEEDN